MKQTASRCDEVKRIHALRQDHANEWKYSETLREAISQRPYTLNDGGRTYRTVYQAEAHARIAVDQDQTSNIRWPMRICDSRLAGLSIGIVYKHRTVWTLPT